MEKTEVVIKKYNFIPNKGYPIVIAQAFTDFDDNDYIEFYLIEGNYNKASKLQIRDFMLLRGSSNSMIFMREYFDCFIEAKIEQYQNELFDLANDNINRSLPLQEMKYNHIEILLGTLKNFNDIKNKIFTNTKSKDIKEILKSIQTINFDCKQIPFEM